MKNVSLRIDGKRVRAPEGATILEAAKQAGIDIPTLCHSDGLKPYGACRMCMVEIQKDDRTKLVASCVYPVEEGLVVQTKSETVIKIRRMIIELLWPASQRVAKEYGVTASRFTPELPDCSLCGLCVRYCSEVKKQRLLYFKGRGIDRQPAFLEGTSDLCATCQECFELCTGGWLLAHTLGQS